MEDEKSELYNTICYLQGYLDCLFNIETDFNGSLALFLSPTGLHEFIEEALNSTNEINGELSISSFSMEGNISKKAYSYEFMNGFFSNELIIKPFDVSQFSCDTKGYVLDKLMDVLQEVLFEYFDETKLIEYCHGLHSNKYIYDDETKSYNFHMQVFCLPFKGNQFLIMSLSKNFKNDYI